MAGMPIPGQPPHIRLTIASVARSGKQAVLTQMIARVEQQAPQHSGSNAAQEGEPPGRWFGKGAEALGFTDAQEVERDPYLAAYQQADPDTGGGKLGRAPNGYKR